MEIHILEERSLSDVPGSACTSPQTWISCSGYSVLRVAQVIPDITPTCLGGPELSWCFWKGTPRPVPGEDKRQSHDTALISQPWPLGRTEMEKKMIVFSTVERKSTVHMQTLGKKGDGASPKSPDGDGNSDSSVGSVGRETC